MSRAARSCDVCRKVRNDVVIYSLIKAEKKAPDGTLLSRAHGAGSIDLCDPCWERIGKPRLKPARATRLKAQDRARAEMARD